MGKNARVAALTRKRRVVHFHSTQIPMARSLMGFSLENSRAYPISVNGGHLPFPLRKFVFAPFFPGIHATRVHSYRGTIKILFDFSNILACRPKSPLVYWYVPTFLFAFVKRNSFLVCPHRQCENVELSHLEHMGKCKKAHSERSELKKSPRFYFYSEMMTGFEYSAVVMCMLN